MYSLIDLINNAIENEIHIFGIFATKCLAFIIPISFETDIFCTFILVITTTSIKYVNITNVLLLTFTFVHRENMFDID